MTEIHIIRGLEVNVEKSLTRPSFTKITQPIWRHFNDGWFDFWVCSLCGKRSWIKESQCPACKNFMINGDNTH